MIEMHEDEYLESNFTDITLQFIQDMYGPAVKDMLLTRTVVIDVHPADES